MFLIFTQFSLADGVYALDVQSTSRPYAELVRQNVRKSCCGVQTCALPIYIIPCSTAPLPYILFN